MVDETTPPDPALDLDSHPMFRADVDQGGDWYVWRRVGVRGWATMRRCESEQQALEIAEQLNNDPNASIF